MNHVPTQTPDGHAAVFQALGTLLSLPLKLQELEQTLARCEQVLEANERLSTKLDQQQPVRFQLTKRIVRSAAVLAHKLDGTVEVVCNHLQQVHDAIAASEALIEQYGDSTELNNNRLMWRREWAYWSCVAREFDVACFEVQPGDEFDADRHTVSTTVTTDDPERFNTVQKAGSLCFRWRDDHGVEQYQPADVVLFLGEGD